MSVLPASAGGPRMAIVRPGTPGSSQPSVMTGGGQPQQPQAGRLPGQQTIVLRPGQPGGVVTLPGGSISRPLLVNQSPGNIRVRGPGVGARAAAAAAAISAGRNVVINQPGMRPGQPGSQITVPLQTLQTMRPGQGIPTGQDGHLLVKTENGQYQILRVGTTSSSTSSSSTTTSLSHPMAHQLSGIRPTSVTLPARPTIVRQTTPQSVAVSSPRPTQQVAPTPSSTASSSNASAAASSGGGMGNQMTPDTAKLKCKNFLATLLRLASEQPPVVATNVRNLIQGLIDGKVDPETFTTKLQKELNSSPQPCLVPFLKKSLPYLQQSLSSGELSIDGVRAPANSRARVHVNTTVVHPPAAGMIQRPTNVVVSSRPPMEVMRSVGPITTVVRPPIMTHANYKMPQLASMSNKPMFVPPKMVHHPVVASSSSSQQLKEKKTSNSFSAAGDEDINDVAAMGGVNLAEESQRMQGATDLIGTQIRSCKDETFLQTGLLHKRVAKLCRDRGLEEPSNEVLALVSHATQDRLKTLLEKLSVISEHRLDIVKQEGDYEVTQDVKGQLRFLGELDKLERRRHEEAERELLLRAAKSRTKTEDPEKEKLKAKAKELQRLEEEQRRHETANNTALLAIGGPRKKMKLDSDQFVSSGGGGGGNSGGQFATSLASRPRTKRVHVRDLMFLMEQEKDLKRSPLLWKAFCS